MRLLNNFTEPYRDYSDYTQVFEISVKNTGNFSGKETVQIYCEQPQGKLGKAARILCGFKKTGELRPGEEEVTSV